ncbi:MAG TPA: TetR/AcrR family transcriptional regulator [Blastocatellia bacterium]|nr:TetR/AcrR family transcriptional regulator [Blastocatellia bacterium]
MTNQSKQKKSRRELKIEQKRLEILQSAAEAFRRNGFVATTMDDISERLLMTKGSLYYYFKNKEEILYFCQDYSLTLLLKQLAEVQRSGAPPDEKLRRVIVGQVAVILDVLKASAMHADFQMLSPPLLKKVIAKRDRYERGIRAIIAEGIARRVFVPCDPKLIALAILGAINWTVKWFSPAGPLSAEAIGEAFADYFLRGLARRPAPSLPVPSGEVPARFGNAEGQTVTSAPSKTTRRRLVP